MDMKPKLRIISPRDPEARMTPSAMIMTMMHREMKLLRFSSPSLSEYLCRISRRMIVVMPIARPAPVPTTAINRVPRITPEMAGGRYSVAKDVRAFFATRSGKFARMNRPTRMPPAPMGGIRNALTSAPVLAALSVFPDRTPWA